MWSCEQALFREGATERVAAKAESEKASGKPQNTEALLRHTASCEGL